MTDSQLQNSVLTLFAHLRPVLGEASKAAAKDSLYSVVSTKVTSMDASEIYRWLHEIPGMREFLGSRDLKDVRFSDWQIFNRKWESTIQILREDVERDKLGQYTTLAATHGESCGSQPDKVLLDIMVNGFNRKCYTGKNFFDANHFAADKVQKFTNKTDLQLARSSFREARAAMLSVKNGSDDPWCDGRDLQLVVSPKWEAVAEEIVVAERLANGATNTDAKKATVRKWSRLAGEHEDKWFLAEVGRPIKPFAFQEEVALQYQSITDPKSDHVFKTDTFLFGAYARNNVGYLFPQLAYGSTGETPVNE